VATPDTNAYGIGLTFLTTRRTLVTGASGEPFKAVVRNVASRAAEPVPSKATAVSFNETCFSPVSTGVVTCAFAIKALHKTTKKAASFFMTWSPSSLSD
jgi:hypothetical protein